MTWATRKAERREKYQREHGRKLVTCVACNGSGRYDHNGSPPCGACNGTGKVREDAPGDRVP
jgi:DnaJ-class molecular chaperone